MNRKTKSNKTKNPEFERTKDAFRQIFSVPKEKLEEMQKRQSKRPPQNKEKIVIREAFASLFYSLPIN